MHSQPTSLADIVADPSVARLVDDVRTALGRLHSEVRVAETSVDLQAEFRGVVFCRLAPYRELLHFQVGHDPVWETRLRTAAEFPPVMERIVRAFLHAYARARS
jgi:hypothetical protein